MYTNHAPLSHRLFRSPTFFGIAGRVTDSDCVYSILPLYHSHGLAHNGGPMIYTGATLVIRRKFSAKNFWTDCAKYNCTVSWLITNCCLTHLNEWTVHVMLSAILAFAFTTQVEPCNTLYVTNLYPHLIYIHTYSPTVCRWYAR